MHTDLWNYCLHLYARPGIEHACLELQNRGMDVCLLLCAAWLQTRGVNCDEGRLTQLQDCARPWQRDVIQPLRHLRMQWREAAAHDETLATLRMQVKTLELEAERTLLLRLESLTRQWLPGQRAQTCDWLRELARVAGQPDCDTLQALRAAINHA
ncbi:TIGR02444 family protein [Pseudomonas lundensis]|jgi:uncharacterized protein (TIGR02444 family)|uniref:TIGR02444 family protein n=1 Tax=Pseudomonas TaxID=286 RepID=UPI0006419CB1|nr:MULTISPECIES: TIGR02444 family protein [Pseudomonas]AOZ13132.1 TIGR02444 family protein [Pseudomonas lundensis]MBM1180578.1 TIGR02444 family protein [Pseudomonas lundensis]NNA11841.1 TIGR02444 family protein [Pseudomonas lundensis]NNA21697.1 TIGR02444 family protein [Pseudomonas lundensis]NNA27007.1 TIGR02444 family protein [Pseudomonas lundensis]